MTAGLFLEILLSLTIQATVVVMATYWICRVVDVPAIQCRLWNTAYVLLLLLVAAGAVFPHLRLLHPWQTLAPVTVARLAHAESTAGLAVFWVWAIGAGISLGLLVREWWRAIRFLKTCAPVDIHSLPVAEEFDATKGGVPGRRHARPRILISPEIGSPFCCQWHRPQLVLPAFLQHAPADEMRFVVRHELEHLRSGHPLQLFLQRLVETVFWFHPLIHWAAQQAALAREFACDDAAVSSRKDVIGYLKMLLAIAEQGQSREAEGAVLFFGRGAAVMARRGRRLVHNLEQGRRTVDARRQLLARFAVPASALAAAMIWAPLDVLGSSRSAWSPWPTWSAQVLRMFDIAARDFEPYETRTRLYELNENRRSVNSDQ